LTPDTEFKVALVARSGDQCGLGSKTELMDIFSNENGNMVSYERSAKVDLDGDGETDIGKDITIETLDGDVLACCVLDGGRLADRSFLKDTLDPGFKAVLFSMQEVKEDLGAGRDPLTRNRLTDEQKDEIRNSEVAMNKLKEKYNRHKRKLQDIDMGLSEMMSNPAEDSAEDSIDFDETRPDNRIRRSPFDGRRGGPDSFDELPEEIREKLMSGRRGGPDSFEELPEDIREKLMRKKERMSGKAMSPE